MRFTRLVGLAGVIALLIGTASSTLRSTPTSITPRRRADTTRTHDPIARLQARLDAGELTLPHDSASGYLAGVLRALNIPVASQGLVFSRTSLQTDKIAPWAPRAIYFNDDVYIGFVQGSHFLEVAAVDPTSGAVFYTLSQEPRARPTFSRETTTCLMCHQSRAATGGVPGFMVLSTLADWSARLLSEAGDWPAKVTAFHPAMAVHGRFGQPCPDCGTPVQRIVRADNETNYCARCQTGGKLLADRALSRLLKESWPKNIDELG